MLHAIQSQLAQLSNPDAALFLARYFKTAPGQYGAGDIFRGIRVPPLRKLARSSGSLPLPHVEELLRSPYHEDRLLALLILVQQYAKADQTGRTRIHELYLASTRFINNWDLVDCSAEHVVGAYLWGRDQAPLDRLALSESLWERRIAVMATFHHIKRGSFHDTTRIAEALLSDKEDLIHKAVGWMLREIGKRDPAAEEEFLLRHHGVMPRTMLRYAIEKFPEEKRLRYLKGLP